MEHTPQNSDIHLALIDGSGFIFRAYHALPPLTRQKDGLPIGAVSGFCNMLYKLIREGIEGIKPTHLAVIFDTARTSFRNEIYPEYKANRPPPPEDLIPQFPIIREAVNAFSIESVEKIGYEADDIIASYSQKLTGEKNQLTIISSDKDLMQLVSHNTHMYDAMKQKQINPDIVKEKFGVFPNRVIDVQALAGDPTDNIPGVPGIGIKTAAELINRYGSLETVFDSVEQIPQPKRRERLSQNKQNALISKQLVTLRTDIEDLPSIESFALQKWDMERLISFFNEMELKQIKSRVLTHHAQSASENGDLSSEKNKLSQSSPLLGSKPEYICVQTEQELTKWINQAYETGICAVDLETTSLNIIEAKLVGVSLSINPHKACYIPLGHVHNDLIDQTGTIKQIPIKTALNLLTPLLTDQNILKIGQNIKYDMAILKQYDIEIMPYDDTMLISYVLAAGLHHHNMDELARIHLDTETISYKSITGGGKTKKTFDQLDLKTATQYAAEDADITLRLWKVLKNQLAKQHIMNVYEMLERPLPPIIADMEYYGIKINPQILRKLSSDFSEKMIEIEQLAHHLAGCSFNLGSPKQIGEILFEQLGLSGRKKTRTGAWSTNAEQLEQMAQEGHELPRLLLEWRQWAKLKSTYTDALIQEIHPQTKRVHTSFSLSATSTGRLASSNPNLQNIPIRTEEGRKIRTAFITEPDHVLMAADYSQIELRILAHIANIQALKLAFKNNEDIHTKTASEMFSIPQNQVNSEVRRQAKAINFGIIYGISANGLARNIGVSREKAKAFIEAYFQKFPEIKTYMETIKQQAFQQGYVQTIFGRKCYISGIKHKNPMQRGFAERQAINAPIQGSAADIIKRAMIKIPQTLKQQTLRAKMLLQVHDELVFELPETEIEQTKTLIRSIMEQACLPYLNLSVPLIVEIKTAKNWSEAH